MTRPRPGRCGTAGSPPVTFALRALSTSASRWRASVSDGRLAVAPARVGQAKAVVVPSRIGCQEGHTDSGISKIATAAAAPASSITIAPAHGP